MTTLSVTLEMTLTQTNKQISADMGGEVAMLNIETGNYYHSNETGTRIWELLETPQRGIDLCDRLIAEFDVDRETCEAEVLSHLQKLLRNEMVEVVE
jgi:hypothetical protein